MTTNPQPSEQRVAEVVAQSWLEVRPDDKGDFDEIVARFADGMVHVETMNPKGVYIGFYCDDGRAHQLWISSDKKLHYSHADDSSPPASLLSNKDQ